MVICLTVVGASDKYVTDAVQTMYSRFNSLLLKFHSATSEFKYFLFKTNCMALYALVSVIEFDSSITEKDKIPEVNAADVFFRFPTEHTQTLSICSVLMLILICYITQKTIIVSSELSI